MDAHIMALVQSQPFFWLTTIGIGIFALNAILIAVEQGYDLWGRLVLGMLQGLGGGTIRDFLIGGGRLPPDYMHDPTRPALILIIVLVVSLASATRVRIDRMESFQRIKRYADIFGFAMMATAGGCICIGSGLAWYWAPLGAALTSAGGGALRDIASNKAPVSFQGQILEEVAVLGGLLLPLGEYINHLWNRAFDGSLLIAVFTWLVMVVIRTMVVRYEIRYPAALLYKVEPMHVARLPLTASLGPLHQQLRHFITAQALDEGLPRELMVRAAELSEECLSLFSALGRQPPTEVTCAIERRQMALTFTFPGEPLEIAHVAAGSVATDASVNDLAAHGALALIRHHAHDLTTAPLGNGSSVLTIHL
jgi:uncharacterized membrane protein YeiH